MEIVKEEPSSSSRNLLADTLKSNDMLNVVKFLSAICVIGIHCRVFANSYLNFAFQQWFARFAVPLFFVSTGFYFAKMDEVKRANYINRIGVLYLISMLVYSYFWIPIGASHFALSLIRTILFGYHHLWYLSALFMALVLMRLWYKLKLNDTFELVVAGILLFGGVFLGVYYKLLPGVLYKLCDLFKHVGRGRNFATFGFPLILIGDWIYRNRDKVFSVCKSKYIALLCGSAVLSLVEVYLVQRFLGCVSDVFFFNWPIGVFIFILTFYAKPFSFGTNGIRKLADYIYIIHPLVIKVVNKLVNFRNVFSFIIIVIVSVVSAFIVNGIINSMTSRKASKESTTLQ